MPYLVPFGDRAVLMIGARNNPCWTGSYDPTARRFHPDRREPRYIDLGLYYCVNPHLVDDRGPDGAPRRLLHGWVLGARSPVDTVPYWIGAHSILRVLELAGDELVQSPAPEIQTLRGAVHRQRDLTIVPGAKDHLEHVAGDALELEMTVDLRRTRAHRFGAAVRVSGDGRGAHVWYEPAGNRIGVDRLLGPEQVYANPAATQRGDLQGAVEKLQAPQVTAPAGERSRGHRYPHPAHLRGPFHPGGVLRRRRAHRPPVSRCLRHRRRPVRGGWSGPRQDGFRVAAARHLVSAAPCSRNCRSAVPCASSGTLRSRFGA